MVGDMSIKVYKKNHSDLATKNIQKSSFYQIVIGSFLN